MILCADVKNYLKANFKDIEHFYVGKLDTKYKKSLCVYDLKHNAPVKTIGGVDTKKIYERSFTILVHYDGFTDTERVAQDLYDFISELSNVKIGNNTVSCVSMISDHPVNVGADSSEVYERTIDFTIYYV